ncbi:TPA: hypothetical protein N0F65_000006 [Lagenidium giganteum]|uniref:Centrosomal protein of 70 kDa n=1 Tax=Lagenidium giganteum TaxID=4803 RepID=A0AAV2YLB4_9STRA|nr:TPA: hypothetical protein N0F65_000006 [Lagenidium giganteum]
MAGHSLAKIGTMADHPNSVSSDDMAAGTRTHEAHANTGDSGASSSDFSCSSVDRFLRDHGFDIDDGDLVDHLGSVSSLGGSRDDAPNNGEDDRAALHGASGERVTPEAVRSQLDRVVAQDDDVVAAVEHLLDGTRASVDSAPGSDVLPVERRLELSDASNSSGRESRRSDAVDDAAADEHESLDRSMLLGAASTAVSSNSSTATNEKTAQQPTRPAHHSPGRVSPSTARLQRRKSSDSSSMRVHDLELNDALGVTAVAVESARSSDGSERVRTSLKEMLRATEEEEKLQDIDVLHRRSRSPPWQETPAALSSPSALSVVTSEDSRTHKKEEEWSELNDLLRKHALPTVQFTRAINGGVTPDRQSLFATVHDLVLLVTRKDQIIQDLVVDSNQSSKQQSRLQGSLQSSEKKVEESVKAFDESQRELKRLKEKMKRERDQHETQVKQLKSSCVKLQQQLKVSEHRVKAKEVLVDRMQQKLQQHVDKENMTRERDRQVLKQWQQPKTRRRGATEHVAAFEARHEQMQSEIQHLKEQVQALNAEVRDKDNCIARYARAVANSDSPVDLDAPEGSIGSRSSRADAYSNTFASDEMLDRLEAARRDQERAAAKLRQREAHMLKKVAEIEEELNGARETIAELKEENANLALEVESRPSIRDYRLSQRRIHLLERQLSEHKLALEEAKDINELRRYMGTKELIDRDRTNHRLQLNRLNSLPRETTLEVVKDVCRLLNLTDITMITPSIEKLCNVVKAVPRMEKFIRDVCGFVFFHQDPDGRGNNQQTGSLEEVIPTLQQWMHERRKLHALSEFKAAIVSELCKRSIEPALLTEGQELKSAAAFSQAVHMVSELVELEKNVIHHREIYLHAAQELERRPSVLVNQIVRHFMHLFKVKSVDGVLPKINGVYLFVNEMENFLRVLRKLLLLNDSASVNACMAALQEKVEGKPENSHSPQHRSEKPTDGQVNYVVDHRTRAIREAADDKGGLVGVRQVREMALLIRDLKRELGAATNDDILPRTRRLMELLSLSIHQPLGDE